MSRIITFQAENLHLVVPLLQLEMQELYMYMYMYINCSAKSIALQSQVDSSLDLLISLREDSQIDFASGKCFLHVSLRPLPPPPPPSRLETFQSKINNQFKMCALADVYDTKIGLRPRRVGL